MGQREIHSTDGREKIIGEREGTNSLLSLTRFFLPCHPLLVMLSPVPWDLNVCVLPPP